MKTVAVVYAYIGKPDAPQIERLLESLKDHGVTLTHLGKNDPPRKFAGDVQAALSMVLAGKDLTNYTFMRDSGKHLDLSIQIHNDPQWSHSTISASCSEGNGLESVCGAVLASLELCLLIRGTLGFGKEQSWEILHLGENCPEELRTKFA